MACAYIIVLHAELMGPSIPALGILIGINRALIGISRYIALHMGDDINTGLRNIARSTIGGCPIKALFARGLPYFSFVNNLV